MFSLPVGTEMFHFPTFPPTALCVQTEVAGHYSGFFRGFPIRRSPDRSSFTSSPGLIAGYNVLHRLLVPRHPPIALSSLLLLQRCSRPLCSSQRTTRHPPHDPAEPNPPRKAAGGTRNRTALNREEASTPGFPRDMARSLRTQQRAYDRPTPDTPFHTPPK